MYKLIRVLIKETGGEFTCGTIDDKKLVKSIKTKIDKEGEIGSSCELNNGYYFDAVMYDNIFHFYAPNVRGANVVIEEAVFESELDYENSENLEFNEIFEGSIEESGINVFNSSCPGDPEVGDGELIIYSKKYEKRITSSFYIKLKNNEIFDPKNIYLGYSLLDEVMDFVEDEILEHFLYIPKSIFKSYLEIVLKKSGKEFDENNLDKNFDYDEIMQEELWDSDLTEKIKNDHKINSYSTEGKGEWENDYLKFIDSEDEVLYEDGYL